MSATKTEGESLTWNVRPSDSAPHKRYVVLLAALAAGLFGIYVLDQALLGIVGFAIILASTAEFWLGVRYSIGPKGASARVGLSVTAIEWGDVKRVVVNDLAIKLSPLAEEGKLDPFRGLILRTTDENRDSVRGLVLAYCGSDVRLVGN